MLSLADKFAPRRASNSMHSRLEAWKSAVLPRPLDSWTETPKSRSASKEACLPSKAWQSKGVGNQKDRRDRQTKMIEEQLASAAKRAADQEAEDLRKLEHTSKSRKTEGEIGSAKERYLARKKAAEEAKKNGNT